MRIYNLGECITFGVLHYRRGDYAIVEASDRFYVTTECRRQLHGGYVPTWMVESWSAGSFAEAIRTLERMEQSKAHHCKQFNCE